MLKQTLDNRKDLQHLLFIRGFLITTNEIPEQEAYPFYGNWKTEKIGSYHFYVHNLQKLHTLQHGKTTFFLIGHAYNPYTMEHVETKILQQIAEALDKGEAQYMDAINELTGIFTMGHINGSDIRFLLDCSGMQYAAYGSVDNHLYIASHIQLFTDICQLEMDTTYVKKLINYRWYKYMMGNYLPGDLTPFNGIKRIIPNTWVDMQNNRFNVVRFYPRKALEMCKTEDEYNEVIKQAADTMHNNMELITRKWENPAISLTGGIDSNTTFAAANGLYDKYRAFTYISMFRESVDAEVAAKISRKFNVPHTVYKVPDTNGEIKDFEIYKAILDHNAGEIGPTKDNDTRKKIILMQNDVGEVEVKSWISETIRAYAYKYFGRTTMPKNLKPRHYTSLYKIFFLNRWLVWKTDGFYKEYLQNTQLKKHLYNYDESDFFVWEMMHGGKCGLNIGTMKFCFDITIPYNNRKFIDNVLRVPLEYRINDRHHLDMKKYLNRELYNMNSRVVNLNETKRRKQMANLYFTVNSAIPF